MDPDEFLWHEYHRRRRQSVRHRIDVVTWVVLTLLAAGLVFVLLVSRPV